MRQPLLAGKPQKLVEPEKAPHSLRVDAIAAHHPEESLHRQLLPQVVPLGMSRHFPTIFLQPRVGIVEMVCGNVYTH
ncbi:hypothetical protein [Muribaculum intestinale]|nr:hypothetical protein [Muribaculum intestinale]